LQMAQRGQITEKVRLKDCPWPLTPQCKLRSVWNLLPMLDTLSDLYFKKSLV